MNTQSGNVVIYILVAVALFGALTFTLSRINQGGNANTEISEAQATAYATQILSYAGQAASVIEQMKFNSSLDDTIDFTLPTEGTFNDDPTIHKLYHVTGGGLNYKPMPDAMQASDNAALPPGFYIGRFEQIDWTESTDHDIVFAAHEINQNICAKLNEKIIGDPAIPALVGETPENLFVDDSTPSHGGTNAPFTSTECPTCEGRPAMCVSDAGGTKYTFYNILVAR